MCNDYGLKHPLTLINQAFSQIDRPLLFVAGAPNLEPRDDIWPTERAPVVRSRADGKAEMIVLPWGLAPSAPKRPPVINFRSEGRRFANAPAGGDGATRVLVPASHFYEFTAPAEGAPKRAPKSKWEFTWADAGDRERVDDLPPLFCLAGWTRNGAFTLLTCAPGPDVAPYHDRQVVVLDPRAWATWLDGDAEEATALLAPAPAGTLRVRQVR